MPSQEIFLLVCNINKMADPVHYLLVASTIVCPISWQQRKSSITFTEAAMYLGFAPLESLRRSG